MFCGGFGFFRVVGVLNVGNWLVLGIDGWVASCGLYVFGFLV